MSRRKTWTSLLLTVALFGLLMLSLLLSTTLKEGLGYGQDSAVKHLPRVEGKQKGAHVFGRPDSANIQRLQQANVEWVTLVPWGHQADYNSPEVRHHNGDTSHIRFHDSSWVHQIEVMHAAGFKVFFKPHIWIRSPSDGKWRSDISPDSEEEWTAWSNSYRNFILRNAKVAERARAEMFCIGTEFSRLSVEKPEFWRRLIRQVREVYSGELTYAANWYHEFDRITFWKDLDYIGIQAYFPLVENRSPSVEEVSAGWNKYLPVLDSVHQRYDRRILFTEMGYKSTADSAIEPWEWIRDPSDQERGFSLETQANCYGAFFNVVWAQEWFAGVHVWQLRGDWNGEVGRRKLDFTPQGKPAMEVIAKGFE